MKRFFLSLAVAGALFGAVAVTAACGGDGDSGGMGDMGGMGGGMTNASQPAGSIRVGLVNWEVEPAQSEAKAGTVTFWAVHDMDHGHMSSDGGVTHDLQVMKKNADGSLQLVGQVQGLTMGQAKELTLTLAPGDYELSCNVVEQVDGKVVGHYAKGMRAPFKVTA
ncbi:MAG: hypothetical protein HY875_02435 [Chloroflexi bacterium]|nr:hypothetical protein [Chloroflexota bacterium]